MHFHTAFTVLSPHHAPIEHCVPVAVEFRSLDGAEIDRYLALEQPFDCAGAAKCEGLGIALLREHRHRRPDRADRPAADAGRRSAAAGRDAADMTAIPARRSEPLARRLSGGRLLLIPAPLEQVPEPRPWLCEPDRQLAAGLVRFYVETPKTARLWLKALPVASPLQSLQIRAHCRPRLRIRTGANGSRRWRPVKRSGCCLTRAAPGSPIPAPCWSGRPRRQIEVHPLIGPSSLLLALMASGLNGQRFTFQGYLPVDRVGAPAGDRQTFAPLGRASARLSS